MSDLAVVTPSYAPDLELFAELRRSVVDYFPPGVTHVVIVPCRDVEAFARFSSPHCEIIPESALVPRHVLKVPRTGFYLNARRPLPPIRGWVLQQLLKLASVDIVTANTVVLVDSDVVFVRPVDEETFAPGGRARFFRLDAAIDDRLPRHVRWHAAASRLLGIPPDCLPLPDYVTSLNTWDRQTVLDLLRRIEDVAGRSWFDVIGSELHFSEWTLYGKYVDHFIDVPSSSDALCHTYWDPKPLDQGAADRFVSDIAERDVAVMISAKSRTPLAVRRAAISALRC
jgi:hypothetical protein